MFEYLPDSLVSPDYVINGPSLNELMCVRTHLYHDTVTVEGKIIWLRQLVTIVNCFH